MSAKVTLFGCMILWIDKDGVVGAGGNARFTANTDGFIKIHYTVRAGVHRSRWAGLSTGRVLALVAASDLEGPTRVGKDADVNVFDIGAID
jgi:ethanolamine utilization microcompartment shell protein EutL